MAHDRLIFLCYNCPKSGIYFSTALYFIVVTLEDNMKQKAFLVSLFIMAVFAFFSCDSLWEHENKEAVEISFTIPQEWLDSFVEEAEAVQQAQRASGGQSLQRASVNTSITAKASIQDAETGAVLAEQAVNLGNNLNESIRFQPLYIVGSTVYVQVELTQYGHLSRSRKSDPLTVVEGNNPVTFDMGEAEKVTWKLSFDSNGGIDAVDTQSVLHLEKATLPGESASMTVPSDKEFFLGWTKTRNGNDWVVFPYEVTESDTLYARWANPGEYTELEVEDNGPDELTIGYNTDSDADVIIPPVYKGKPITSISTFAFEDNTAINSIIFSEFIVELKDEPFSNTPNLRSVILNEGLKILGDYAFYNCTSLTEISIPSTVSSIGSFIVQDSGIQKITVHPKNATFEAIDNVIYTKGKNKSLVLYLPSKTDEHFAIPFGVTSIGGSAFKNTGLTSIDIPSSVTSIGSSAFADCTELTNIDIPSSVTNIGVAAFSGCTGLTSIEIPLGVTSIGEATFSGCTGLTNVIIPSSVTSIGIRAFVGCEKLTSIILPTNVTSIDNFAFQNTGLTSIDIPSSVKSINQSAFMGCTSLETVTLRDPVPPALQTDSFDGATALTTIYVPAGSGDAYQGAQGWSVHSAKIQEK